MESDANSEQDTLLVENWITGWYKEKPLNIYTYCLFFQQIPKNIRNN